MEALEFSLLPAAIGRMYDAVACLAKFSETLSIEARSDRVCARAHESSEK